MTAFLCCLLGKLSLEKGLILILNLNISETFTCLKEKTTQKKRQVDEDREVKLKSQVF